jgi:hypothetical protein
VRKPARDDRNNDTSGYDKYGSYAYVTVATVATVATDGSDHRRRLLSRERGGSEGCDVHSGNPLHCLLTTPRRFAGHTMREITSLEYNFANSV